MANTINWFLKGLRQIHGRVLRLVNVTTNSLLLEDGKGRWNSTSLEASRHSKSSE